MQNEKSNKLNAEKKQKKRIIESMDSSSYKKLEQEIMQMLAEKLPPDLHYHSAEHVRDVIAAAEYISKAEELVEEDINLVKTAALFHDSGFTMGYEYHEENGCQ